jgi:hypothetical protein
MMAANQRWSKDELAVLDANYARGDSIRISARILGRTEHRVRQQELQRGLWRRQDDPRHKRMQREKETTP